jgi:hypothetical protein
MRCLFEIPNLPTLAGSVIKPGDRVLEVQQAQLEWAVLEWAVLEWAVLAVKSGGAELAAFTLLLTS